MPVTAVHPQYDDNIEKWRRCRDAVAGEDHIKAKGTTYLPRLGGHSDAEYDSYKKRALWYNASARTVDGLTGLIFRKPPALDIPRAAEELLEDVTTDGLSVQEFAEMIVEETVVVGRGGILVDYPRVEVSESESQAEKERRGDRPYLTHYAAEAITNWATGRLGNRTVLTMVVLAEAYLEPHDEFTAETKQQYRVLEITDGGTYQQRIFRYLKNQDTGEWEWVEVDRAVPLLRGAPLDFIPFYFFGPRDATPGVAKPPVLDLVNMNLSHYRTMADLENGAHWTGVPTPVFIGRFVTEDEEEVTEVKVGSTDGLHLESDGDAKFLEFTGAGLDALEKRANAKEEMMAVLGARILAQEKRMAEAAETARIHRAGESATLASIANAVSKVLSRAVTFLLEWSGIRQKASVELNTDFIPEQLDAQMLTGLLQAWQQQAIAFEDLVYALQQGDVVRDDRSAEEIRQDIQDNPPSSAMIGGLSLGNGE